MTFSRETNGSRDKANGQKGIGGKTTRLLKGCNQRLTTNRGCHRECCLRPVSTHMSTLNTLNTSSCILAAIVVSIITKFQPLFLSIYFLSQNGLFKYNDFFVLIYKFIQFVVYLLFCKFRFKFYNCFLYCSKNSILSNFIFKIIFLILSSNRP